MGVEIWCLQRQKIQLWVIGWNLKTDATELQTMGMQQVQSFAGMSETLRNQLAY